MKKLSVLLAVFFLTASVAFAQQKPAAPAMEPKVEAAAKEAKAEPAAKFPAIDVIKAAESYILIFEIPGVDSKNINVEFIEGEKNYLEITGTKDAVDIKTKGERIQSELFGGKFARKIDIADRIVKEKISAEFKDSVLIVTLPVLKAQVKTTIKITK